MTDSDRQSLRPGDRVVYLDDEDREREGTVGRKPYRISCGELVVWFREDVGCYLLGRVVRKVEG